MKSQFKWTYGFERLSTDSTKPTIKATEWFESVSKKREYQPSKKGESARAFEAVGIRCGAYGWREETGLFYKRGIIWLQGEVKGMFCRRSEKHGYKGGNEERGQGSPKGRVKRQHNVFQARIWRLQVRLFNRKINSKRATRLRPCRKIAQSQHLYMKGRHNRGLSRLFRRDCIH